jgi:hypothetical protein
VTPLLLVLHVLLLVSWLGVDVGVFYGSFAVVRPGLEPQTRAELRRVMRLLDLGPRLSLVLMIPVGAALAYSLGTGLRFVSGTVAAIGLVAVALAALAWFAASVREYQVLGQGGDGSFRRYYVPVDWALRILVIAFAVASASASLAGAGIWSSRTVAVKVLLFGLIVAAGLVIRVYARRYVPLLMELIREGETPERLARLRLAMRPVRTAVLAVWIGLIAIVVISFVHLPPP